MRYGIGMRIKPLTDMVGCLRGFWDWLAQGQCIIRDRDGRVGPMVPNALQRAMYGGMLRQAVAKEPLRVIVLKFRKAGSSTGWEAFCYYLVRHYPEINAQLLAHTDDETLAIFAAAARMYQFDPSFRVRPKLNSTQAIGFPFHGSDFSIRTGGGHFAGSGANRSYLVLSELPKWAGEPAVVRARIQSIINSVPLSPFSLIAIESTNNMLDASSEFKERFQAAEEGRGGFLPIFVPWYSEPSYAVNVAEDWLRDPRWIVPALSPPGGYDDDEIKLKALGVTDPQLAWRRRTIIDACAGQLIWFHQDFPATIEEAWEAPMGRVYGMLRASEHDRHHEPAELLREGYRFFRAVDWGGVDPFVCLWIAVDDDAQPQFSIDRRACPNTWREHAGWNWSKKNRPHAGNDHTCDPLRYLVTHYLFRGHVHVFAEYYQPFAAARDESLLEQAAEVKRRNGSWPIENTIADRSQPLALTLFRNQGIPCAPYRRPTSASRYGEIIDGIRYMQALMLGRAPLWPQREVENEEERQERRSRDLDLPQRFGVGQVDVRQAHSDTGAPRRSGTCIGGYL